MYITNLEELRKKYECGMEVFKENKLKYALLVALKKSNGLFNCNRYFFIGDGWELSVDKVNVSEIDARKWIGNE